MTHGQLTGRRRFRRGWFGRVVLQVEYVSIWFNPDNCGFDNFDDDDEGKLVLRWRDAKPEDVMNEARSIHTPNTVAYDPNTNTDPPRPKR